MIKIDKWFPSTKKCSCCGAEKEMTLSERIYQCSCGYVSDRDYNSAINIKNEGLRLLALSIKIKTLGTRGLARSIFVS